jgi:hypothetical protein
MLPGIQVNESELRVDFVGDRRIRLYGADNYDRLRGIYLDCVAMDEYGDFDPRAFPEVIRPRLADRQGWALFAGTAHNWNHFAELVELARTRPEDYYLLVLRASESGLLPKDELEDIRRSMSEEQYLSEFECNFRAALVGSIWGREMTAVEDEGRVCAVPWEPELAVETWWDLGVADATAIWFTQNVGREVHVIDYYQEVGGGMPSFVRALRAKPYNYSEHHAPHDIKVRELGSGKSRLEMAAALGIRFRLVPNIDRADGIEAVRAFLGRCWFDRTETEAGRLALTNYRREYDAKHKVFRSSPVHDWASDAADAFRYLAVGHRWAPAIRGKVIDFPRPMRNSEDSTTSWMGV